MVSMWWDNFWGSEPPMLPAYLSLLQLMFAIAAKVFSENIITKETILITEDKVISVTGSLLN